MIRERVRSLLEDVAAGRASIDQALARLDSAPAESLGFATIDHHRALRSGYPEVVFGEGKTVAQVVTICEHLAEHGDGFLVTRASPELGAALSARFPGVHLNALARTARLAGTVEPRAGAGKQVLIVTAGTSDLPVAEEAAETLAALGAGVARLTDVGVAGIHRLLSQHDALRDAAVVIVVAGMDGALPSVVGGLVRVPVIAVPTSVGYGASFGGVSALLAMLNSCAAGVTVCNIDNGFGAAMAAARISERTVSGALGWFAAGVIATIVVRMWRVGRRKRPAPPAVSGGGYAPRMGERGTPGRGVRASLLESVRDPENPEELVESNERALADDLRGYLGDIGAQHGADDVMFWMRREESPSLAGVAWNHRGAPAREPWGTGHQREIIAWAAAEGVVSFDNADGSPLLAAARVSLDAVAALPAGAATAAAIVLHSPAGIRSSRGDLKLWLPRHAERLTQFVEMQTTRNASARANRWMRHLVRASQDLSANATQQELEQMVTDLMIEASGATFAALVEWDADTQTGVIRFTTPSYPEPVPSAGAQVLEASMVGAACIDGVPKHFTETAAVAGTGQLFNAGTLFPSCHALSIQPMRRGKRVIGAIVIGASDPGGMRQTDRKSVGLFAQLAGTALEASWEIEEVKSTARIDKLTGLRNRRHFDDELKRTLDQTDRVRGASCALVLGDVDHFKAVNDTYGHEAGDQVLKAIAQVMREQVRGTEASARIGGEEFCVMLQQTGAEGATELAERLRSKIEALKIRWHDRDLSVTMSFGIAMYEQGGGPVKRGQLFEAADRALYRAKGEGRNCVRTA